MLVKLKETGQYNKNYFKLFVHFQSRILIKICQVINLCFMTKIEESCSTLLIARFQKSIEQFEW